MKNFSVFLITVVCTVLSINSFAQTGTKPKLFSNFPNRIECNEVELANAFSTNVGQTVDFSLLSNLSGNVTANILRYSNLQSVFIKSTQFDNAIFSLTKATNPDGTIEYSGRIINQNYFDGYELKKNENGTYSLIKIETDQTLHLCSQ
ncbi:MAG: hypothetical protein KA319_09145 [Ferruginibacter sp.]|nr:hypothetical protein [Ferruginibacter sp.]